MNYKDCGVDIEAGNAFVDRLKLKAPAIGGFNGAFKVPKGYESPVLISGTDGVGTKINCAHLDATGNPAVMRGIGIDLVAMCVNDVITCGAKPLYFLDYICTSNLKQHGDLVEHLVDGIIEGCEISEMELLGGETAEHPKRSAMVDPIRDVSGFCTGIVEENELIDGKLIKPGDKVIGIASSGLHSNGYSLINKLLWHQKIFLRYRDKGDEHLGVGEELLKPTRIYAPIVKRLTKNLPILGMAHITGGGIPENLPRCLPDGLEVHVDYNSWEVPQIFKTIHRAAECSIEEMRRTFNMGIGLCVVVPAEEEEEVKMAITPYHDCWTIGDVSESTK